MTNQDVVDSLAVRGTEELFAAYGVDLARQDRPVVDANDEVAFAGVIGFTGPSMRGTLVLAPTRSLLARSHLGSPCALRDWVGELANQLIGRVKNQLRLYAVEIYVTTPAVVKGQCLAPVPRGDATGYCFHGSPGAVSVWLDVEIADGIALVKKDIQTGPTEGDTIIF